MRIENNPVNCFGCDFLNPRDICSRTGNEIKDIKVCLTGPMVQLNKFNGNWNIKIDHEILKIGNIQNLIQDLLILKQKLTNITHKEDS